MCLPRFEAALVDINVPMPNKRKKINVERFNGFIRRASKHTIIPIVHILFNENGYRLCVTVEKTYSSIKM